METARLALRSSYRVTHFARSFRKSRFSATIFLFHRPYGRQKTVSASRNPGCFATLHAKVKTPEGGKKREYGKTRYMPGGPGEGGRGEEKHTVRLCLWNMANAARTRGAYLPHCQAASPIFTKTNRREASRIPK